MTVKAVATAAENIAWTGETLIADPEPLAPAVSLVGTDVVSLDVDESPRRATGAAVDKLSNAGAERSVARPTFAGDESNKTHDEW